MGERGMDTGAIKDSGEMGTRTPIPDTQIPIKESEDMEYILTTNNLSKRYGSVVAADKVNLQDRKSTRLNSSH